MKEFVITAKEIYAMGDKVGIMPLSANGYLYLAEQIYRTTSLPLNRYLWKPYFDETTGNVVYK